MSGKPIGKIKTKKVPRKFLEVHLTICDAEILKLLDFNAKAYVPLPGKKLLPVEPTNAVQHFTKARIARPIDSQRGPGADIDYRGYALRPRYSGGYLVLLRIRGIAGDTRWHTIEEKAESLDAARAIVDELFLP